MAIAARRRAFGARIRPWAALLLGLGACRVHSAAPPPREPPALPAQTPASGVTPAILSAHLSRVDDPQLDGLDGLLIVFNMELDAAAMQPRAFVVSRADAGPVWPKQAIFAPASEQDENRSILLVGEFGDATAEHQPTHVAVRGSLFGEDGTRLSGLGASVTPFSGPLQVVAAAVILVGPERCEGSASVVRTYWSDELRGVEPEDLARVRIQGVKNKSVHPQRFDDHATEYDEAGQDNVLDLCLTEAGPVRRVWVEAGAFHDAAGHPSAAVQLEIEDSGS